MNQNWWRPLVVGATAFSAVVFLIFWNGRTQNLDAQGLVGILIDVAILMIVLVLRWPSTE
jgi:tetrahydromethanopterin S-methyltransferase subunit E